METPHDSAYWTSEFDITEADMDRIAAYICKVRRACDLTELAKRIVRGRLRFGPEEGKAPTHLDRSITSSAKLWNPAGEWSPGDHVIVLHRIGKGRKVFVGEITEVMSDRVEVYLDKVETPTTYLRAPAGSRRAREWHLAVKEAISKRKQMPSIDHEIEVVLLKHGDRIVSHILNALRSDNRLVRLAGRWFLRELVVYPSEEQITALAWAMVSLQEPKPTDALARLVHPPLADGDAGLFGLYLSMKGRPELFKNVDPGQRPRWVLAGPPPGSFVPHHAAYDPDTYEVICLPGRPVPSDVVKRLWDLEILSAVV